MICQTIVLYLKKSKCQGGQADNEEKYSSFMNKPIRFDEARSGDEASWPRRRNGAMLVFRGRRRGRPAAAPPDNCTGFNKLMPEEAQCRAAGKRMKIILMKKSRVPGIFRDQHSSPLRGKAEYRHRGRGRPGSSGKSDADLHVAPDSRESVPLCRRRRADR